MKRCLKRWKLITKTTKSKLIYQDFTLTPLPPLQEGNYEVEFEDGTKVNTKDLDYKLIKPLIWW